MKPTWQVLPKVTCLLLGCGPTLPNTTDPGSVEETSISANLEATSPNSVATSGSAHKKPPDSTPSLTRTALSQFLSTGPAAILAMVDTEPVFKKGAFLGFRITAFHCDPPEVVDLNVGDVVVKINEIRVERPEQFYEVIETLKDAPSLDMVLLRDQSELSLMYEIQG